MSDDTSDADRPTMFLKAPARPTVPADTDDLVTAIGHSVAGTLSVIEGPGAGAVIPFFRGSNTIGRGDHNRVVLDFGDDGIHRAAHAYLTVDRSGCRLGHAGRPNPVYLNGTPVDGLMPVAEGDTIELGQTRLWVEFR